MSLGSAQGEAFVQAVAGMAAGSTHEAQRAQLDAVIEAWARTTGRFDGQPFSAMRRQA